MSAEKPGIYIARNQVTNKVYVGSSVKPISRITDHTRNLNNDRHQNEHLQQAWGKVGKDNFVWEIVERCRRKNLQSREQWWIECLRSNEPKYGYNKAYPVRSHAPSKRMTEVHKAYWSSLKGEERRVRLAHLTDPERNPKINSVRMTERLKDPVFKAKVLAGLTRARNKNNTNPSVAQLAALTKARLNAIAHNKTPEARARQAERARSQQKAKMCDPKSRKKILAILDRGREALNKRKKERALKSYTADNDIV